MASRTSPTERQRRLGSELRKMRTTADVSAENAAGLLGVDRSKLSNIEQGLRAISEDRLRTLACPCGCTDEAYVNASADMARPSHRGWWERYRRTLPSGLLDIAELEAHASHADSPFRTHPRVFSRPAITPSPSFASSSPLSPSTRSPCAWPTGWNASRYWTA